MRTREEIGAWINEPNLDAHRVGAGVEIQQAGYDHGLQGWYQDSDYSSDADWVYGVGQRINDLDAGESDDFFTLYSAAHAEGLAEYYRQNTIATISEPQPEVYGAEVFYSVVVYLECDGQSGRELADEHSTLMGASWEVADRGADDCYTVVSCPDPEDDTAWEAWRNEVATELGISIDNVKDEW